MMGHGSTGHGSTGHGSTGHGSTGQRYQGRSDPAVGPVTQKRRVRLSRDELRHLMLAAGQQIVQEEGVETGATNLTFKRVFEHVEKDTGVQLTNASVIRRVWENQADFQADLLSAIARDHERPEIGQTLHAVAEVVDSFDLSTEESRLSAMRELCRVGGAASSDTLQTSRNWPLWISVVALATNGSEHTSRVRDSLMEGYASVTKFWEENYGGFMDLLGLRFRAPWTMRQYTIAITALSEGYALRQHIEGKLESFTRPTGPDGALQEWTLFAAAMEALVLQFMEPDPEFTPRPPAHV
jgi:hypothetical protein